MLSLSSYGPDETLEIGARLGRLLEPGDFLNLNGSLGAGKTLFVKGLGIGLGIDVHNITSPTFTLLNEYLGVHPLYHFDFYRLEPDFELEQIGYADPFYEKGITVVEWGDLFLSDLPADRLDISFEVLSDQQRRLNIKAFGRRSKDLIERLRGEN